MPHADVGRLLDGRYRLESLLAERADGTALWRVWVPKDNRHAVMSRLGQGDASRERAERATTRLAGIHHPHVAAITGAGDSAGAYVIYDLIDGETATDAIARRRFPLPELLVIADQLAWALEEIHGRGLVHGAITSDGLFLAQRGNGAASAQLMDFGRNTRVDLTAAADLKALARTLYQLTTGIAPSAEPPPLMSLLADEPHLASWDAFLHRALTTAPYESATKMREDLAEISQRFKRARTGRDGRVAVSTAPSMRRAMNEVADFQTTEAAAVPAEAVRQSGASASTDGGSTAEREDLAAVVPTVEPTYPHWAPPAADQERGEGPRRMTSPLGQPRADLASEVPSAEVAPMLAADGRRDGGGGRTRSPWILAAAFGVCAGLAVAAIVATTEHTAAPGRIERDGLAAVPDQTLAPANAGPVAGPSGPGRPTGGNPAPGEVVAATTTRVTIESDPPGATVSNGGAILGTTPLPLEVPFGVHRFDVSLRGYVSQTLMVDVRGADALKHRIRLAPARP